MKKQITLMTILVVIILALAVSMKYLSSAPIDDTSTDISSEILEEPIEETADFASDELSKIIIETDEEQVEFYSSEQGYFVAGIEQMELDQSVMYSVFANSQSIVYTKLDSSEFSLADYGLENPQTKVTFVYEGYERVLNVGNLISVTDSYYVSFDDQTDVYVVDQLNIDVLLYSPYSYAVYDISQAVDVTSCDAFETITLSGSLYEEDITIKHRQFSDYQDSFEIHSYIIEQPDILPANVDKINVLLNISDMTSEGVVGIVGVGDWEEFGISDPYMCLDARAIMSTDAENIYKDIKLTFSEPVDDVVYFTVNDGENIYKATYSNVSELFLSYNDCVSRILLMPFISTVSTIEIEFADKSYLCELTLEDQELVYTTINGTEISVSDFKLIYQQLIGISIDDFAEQVSAQDASEVLSIKYSYSIDKPSDLVEYLEYSSLQSYISINEGNYNFLTYNTNLDAVKQMLADY